MMRHVLLGLTFLSLAESFSPSFQITHATMAARPRLMRGPSTRSLGLRMDGSDDKPAEDSDLWSSLRKRIGPTPDELTGSTAALPTADRMSPNDVVTVVLRALMANDDPWENHGSEILIAYSSPNAKDSDPSKFSTPEALTSKLRTNPDTEYVLDIEDFRIIDERYTDFSQNVIIKCSVLCNDRQWRHVCFTLSRVESRWLINDVGRAAL